MNFEKQQGCEFCRHFWQLSRKQALPLPHAVISNNERQSNLYHCRKCNAYWEESINNAYILTSKELKKYYQKYFDKFHHGNIPESPAEKVANKLKLIQKEVCEYINNIDNWDSTDKKFFKFMIQHINRMLNECINNQFTPQTMRYKYLANMIVDGGGKFYKEGLELGAKLIRVEIEYIDL